jgi:hypothetical protein
MNLKRKFTHKSEINIAIFGFSIILVTEIFQNLVSEIIFVRVLNSTFTKSTKINLLEFFR